MQRRCNKNVSLRSTRRIDCPHSSAGSHGVSIVNIKRAKKQNGKEPLKRRFTRRFHCQHKTGKEAKRQRAPQAPLQPPLETPSCVCEPKRPVNRHTIRRFNRRFTLTTFKRDAGSHLPLETAGSTSVQPPVQQGTQSKSARLFPG
jgi:hypothetical protein